MIRQLRNNVLNRLADELKQLLEIGWVESRTLRNKWGVGETSVYSVVNELISQGYPLISRQGGRGGGWKRPNTKEEINEYEAWVTRELIAKKVREIKILENLYAIRPTENRRRQVESQKLALAALKLYR